MRLLAYIRFRLDGFSINSARVLSEKYANQDDLAVGWGILIVLVAYMVAS